MRDQNVQDLEAERGVLGCLFQGADIEPAKVLLPSDFAAAAHQRIFEAMLSVASQRRELDHLTVSESLLGAGHLAVVGGPQYLMELDASAPLRSNLPAYVATVRDRSIRRALITRAREITAGALDLRSSAVDLALQSSSAIATLGAAGAVELETAEHAFGDLCDDLQAIAEGRKVAAVPTGIDVWDELIGGLPMGNLTCIGAYPSVGKSALVYRMAINLAQAGTKIGFFMLEDSRVAFTRRAVAYESNIPVHRLARERLPEFAMHEVGDAIERSFHWAKNIILTDRSGLTASQVATMARQMVVQRGCQVIFVDHAGELLLDSDEDRHDLRLERAIHQLRDVAKDLGVSVVLLAHFHRPKSQNDKEPRFLRPNSAMWRNSGGFEQASRVAVGLWLSEKHPDGVAATCLKQSEGAKDFDFWMPLHSPSGLIESKGGKKKEGQKGWDEE